MPNYKCVNPDCTQFDKVVNMNKVSLVYKVDKGLIDSGIVCPICSQDRIPIRDPEAGMTTTMLGSPNICKK